MKGEPSRGTSGYNDKSLLIVSELVLDLEYHQAPVPEGRNVHS